MISITGYFFHFSSLYSAPYIDLHMFSLFLFEFRAVLVLPKTAGSAQTHKSVSFIWIVWSTLYVYLCPVPQLKRMVPFVSVFGSVSDKEMKKVGCITLIYFQKKSENNQFQAGQASKIRKVSHVYFIWVFEYFFMQFSNGFRNYISLCKQTSNLS